MFCGKLLLLKLVQTICFYVSLNNASLQLINMTESLLNSRSQKLCLSFKDKL